MTDQQPTLLLHYALQYTLQHLCQVPALIDNSYTPPTTVLPGPILTPFVVLLAINGPLPALSRIPPFNSYTFIIQGTRSVSLPRTKNPLGQTEIPQVSSEPLYFGMLAPNL